MCWLHLFMLSKELFSTDFYNTLVFDFVQLIIFPPRREGAVGMRGGNFYRFTLIPGPPYFLLLNLDNVSQL
jgi:hypothetical protein